MIFYSSQNEYQTRQVQQETEMQHLSEQLFSLQRRLNDEKGSCLAIFQPFRLCCLVNVFLFCDVTARSVELAAQTKSAKTSCDAAKQELNDYKEKATRILQSKDKLISALKDGK